MRTNDFKEAVDEIMNNGGSRQTIYIHEIWRDRCMTIFSYKDGSAEIFEETRPYMTFDSTIEALFTLNKIQSDYDKSVDADRNKYSRNENPEKIESWSVEDWYSKAPRGTYYGD